MVGAQILLLTLVSSTYDDVLVVVEVVVCVYISFLFLIDGVFLEDGVKMKNDFG